MKTIVIRPEIIGFDNTGVREPRKPRNKAALASLVLIPAVALAGWGAGRFSAEPHPKKTAAIVALNDAAIQPERGAQTTPVPTAPVLTEGALDIKTAVDAGVITAEFLGNGREQMQATLTNSQPHAVVVRISFGQMFEAGRNLVTAVRNAEAEIPAGQGVTLAVPVAATRSTNTIAVSPFRLSARTTPKIDLLLGYAQDHPELTQGALQTAILALTDNLPLSAVCKFAPAGGDLPSRFNTNAFRVETADILGALSTLREIGVRDRDVALTVDPQLKLEAMIEPLLRASARRYYGIAPENEWEFWKAELLAGENGTRHYALFGIARFYPDVALEMLPKWAREKRTNSSFRLAAVQALADTRKAEAMPILEELVRELGRNTELGRAALEAARYLDVELSKVPPAAGAVAFRAAGEKNAEL